MHYKYNYSTRFVRVSCIYSLENFLLNSSRHQSVLQQVFDYPTPLIAKSYLFRLDH